MINFNDFDLDIRIATKASTPWDAFPDDRMLKAFAGFLEKWPKCPLCGGRYGFADHSGLPMTMNKDFRIHCLGSPRGHFHAEIIHKARKGKDQVYISKRANFSLYISDYHIHWNSPYPDKVSVSFFDGRKFETKRLKLNFGSIDRWFRPEAEIKEYIDRLRILL